MKLITSWKHVVNIEKNESGITGGQSWASVTHYLSDLYCQSPEDHKIVYFISVILTGLPCKGT